MAPPDEKLLGEWFWADRWIISNSALLPIGARGLYREMLTHAWVRGCRLPADHAMIRRAVGVSEAEWDEFWPMIAKHWREDGHGYLVPTEGLLLNEKREESSRRRHIPDQIRRAVMERDGHRCQHCGATERLELDHVHPYSLGGADSMENLQALCKPCNLSKGASVP